MLNRFRQSSRGRGTPAINVLESSWLMGLAICLLAISPPLSADGAARAESGVAAPAKAYGRFVPERQDDFTWENDKVAFRVYGPASQGKGQVSGVDAWLKKVPWPVIDNWYEGHLAGKSYHVDHGEGYDPFHVGDSRGVGGTAIWIDGTPWPAGKFKSYEILQNSGPVVEFRLLYEWDTPIGMVAESKTISLNMGEQLYRVNSVFSLDGQPAALPIAIGLTTHDEAAPAAGNRDRGQITTWEEIDGLGLGTAVLLEPEKVKEVLHLPKEDKDASHIWLITSSNDEGELGFRAGFAWEAAGEIMSPQAWDQYLNTVAGW